MRVFVAGGSGAIGRRLVPLLASRGHVVAATTRSPEKMELLHELGAKPVVMDALDRDAVIAAVTQFRPQVVVHQLTDLHAATNLRNFDKAFAVTNRLRTEGTDHLLEAARAAGAKRFVAQSFGNWNYERTGRALKTEFDALDPEPPRTMQRSLDAIVHLETAVLDEGNGIVLRYGNLYGAGTGWTSPAIIGLLQARKIPVIGKGYGMFSFVHVDDAAIATVAAVERGAPGIYNIVDDTPSPVSIWLPLFATALGAKEPRHVPVWLARLGAGPAVVSMFTDIRGASNRKAKLGLGWNLLYPSWLDGLRDGLDEARLDPAVASRLLRLPLEAAA